MYCNPQKVKPLARDLSFAQMIGDDSFAGKPCNKLLVDK